VKCCDVEDLNSEGLMTMIENAWETRDMIRSKLQVTVEAAKRQTWKNAELLQNVIAHRG